jgi:sugar transferase (PEP-CTERM system associated)
MVRIFRVPFPISAIGLLTSDTALVFTCYILACYWELYVDPTTYLTAENGIARIAAFALVFLLSMHMADLYSHVRIRSHLLLIQRIVGVLGGALICEAVIGYIKSDWALPKPVVITGSLLTLASVSLWRILYTSTAARGFGAQKILFLGTAPLASKIARQLRDHPELGLEPIGYVAAAADSMFGVPRLGEPADIVEIVRTANPDRLVVAMAERRTRLPLDSLIEVRLSGVFVEEAAQLYQTAFGRICVDEIRPSQLIFTAALGPQPRKVRLQSLYSTLTAIIGILLTAPLLLLAAILVKLTSRGPVLYRQTRVGLNGKTFSIYKLRSMYQDAEARTGAVWAARNDPRITPLGRFLRKTRIDELPQLFNVLRGEMSIVGPRPERPEFVQVLSQAIPYYRQRLCVKPGITGWAQVNYGYGEDIEDTKVKLEYDLYYIQNLSPSLDLYIMFQTVKIMLRSRGAK